MRFAGTGKWLLAIGLGLAGAATGAAAETLLLRYPDIHGNRLVFCHGGDMYLSSIAGGQAQRLTDFPGRRCYRNSPQTAGRSPSPRKSRGTKISISCPFGGPAPAADVSCRRRMGRRLASGRGTDRLPVQREQRVLPVSIVSISSRPGAGWSGSWSCRKPIWPVSMTRATRSLSARPASICPSRDIAAEPRPRSGLTTSPRGRSDRMIADGSSNSHPIWMGTVSTSSATGGRIAVPNLWVRDLGAGTSRPLTGFKEWPVRWPSRGGDRIVFENGGRLHILDLPAGTVRRVRIGIPRSPDPPEDGRDQRRELHLGRSRSVPRRPEGHPQRAGGLVPPGAWPGPDPEPDPVVRLL